MWQLAPVSFTLSQSCFSAPSCIFFRFCSQSLSPEKHFDKVKVSLSPVCLRVCWCIIKWSQRSAVSGWVSQQLLSRNMYSTAVTSYRYTTTAVTAQNKSNHCQTSHSPCLVTQSIYISISNQHFYKAVFHPKIKICSLNDLVLFNLCIDVYYYYYFRLHGFRILPFTFVKWSKI